MPTRYIKNEKGENVKWTYANGNTVSADEDVLDNLSLLCLLGWLKFKAGFHHPHVDSITEFCAFEMNFGYKLGSNSALRYALESEFLVPPLANRLEYWKKGIRNLGLQLTPEGLALGAQTARDVLTGDFDFTVKYGGKTRGLKNRENYKLLVRAIENPTPKNVEDLILAVRWKFNQATSYGRKK